VFQALSDELQEKEIELSAEKKNSLKRDKTIQGLSLVLKEKEKEVRLIESNIDIDSILYLKTISNNIIFPLKFDFN